jgi:hypothetical protein
MTLELLSLEWNKLKKISKNDPQPALFCIIQQALMLCKFIFGGSKMEHSFFWDYDQKLVKLVIDDNFSVDVDSDDNKIKVIRLLNTKANSIESFIKLSAVLRHFLDGNDVDCKINFNFVDDNSDEEIFYILSFKTVGEYNENLLVKTIKKEFISTDDKKANYNKSDFKSKAIIINGLRAQIWLETLDKLSFV